ncbi:MAG: hypothetical protein LRY31_01060 [Burkholderiaceae bacterium]|nr:hypothetical protein [Burkholderiaceae bacterium]
MKPVTPLPTAWVEKIFRKLSLVYGRDFLARWEGLNSADVIDDWAYELSGFQGWPEAVAWALQNLPNGKPPTVLEFRALCYRAPKPDRPALPEPVARPERLAEELRKLSAIARDPVNRGDGRDWARRIIEKHRAGEKLNPATLRFSREALGLVK